jgi:DNA polymerase-3 subunit delta'
MMTQPTSNWHIYGQDWAVDYLQKSLRNHRARHAYLITGAQSIGKNRLAHAFAQTLQCEHDDEAARPCGECRSCKRFATGNHPDMLYAERDERTGALKIDAIRDLMKLLALKPFASRYRIAILDNFDAAQDRAQDALLKTLEEPPSQAILILTAQTPRSLLKTITSRCQILPLRPAPLAIVYDVLLAQGIVDDQAALLAQLSGGRIGWALNAAHDPDILTQRQQSLELLQQAIIGNRAARFAIAETLGKLDKLSVRYVLEIWQAYWRDILLRTQNSAIPLMNIDHEADIVALAQQVSSQGALAALRATRAMLTDTLYTNANVRLAVEVMLLDYPGLGR